MMRSNVRNLFLAVLVGGLIAGCASKKKVDDQAVDGAQGQAVTVENTAMNFDVQGSDSGKIAGLVTVRFDFDKSTLTEQSKKDLAGNAEWMKGRPNVNIQIEGHCDSRGSIEYNLALGERRAQAVKQYMVGLGVSANRLSIISYGEEKPLAKGDSEADYATNRRANFLPLSQ